MAEKNRHQTESDKDRIVDLAEALRDSMHRNATRPALAFMGERLSYENLEQDAHTIEDFLLESGQEHKSVLIFMEQRPQIVAALLGCLWSGAVFCPIHLHTPEQRLLLILEKLGTNMVLTDQKQQAFWLTLARNHRLSLTVVCVEKAGEKLTLTKTVFSGSSACVKQYDPKVCYIYFSSGSTGMPKGILGRADSLAHFISWEISRFGVTSDAVVSQLTPPSFDPFLRDVLLPLCVGGRLSIPQPDQLSNPRALLQWLQEEKITVTHMVPSLFRILLSAMGSEPNLPDLKHILLAGEMLYGKDVRAFYDRVGFGTTLVNLYGPTETTLAKFCHIVVPEDQNRDRVPVGLPIEGTHAYLSAVQGESANPEEGELLIKAPFEPLGYLNPELTAQRFIPDSHSAEGGRLYCTGDFARKLQNGEIELIGRMDSQVKIRGMLVQPEEVEAILGTHPAVFRCAVYPVEMIPGQPALAAAIELYGANQVDSSVSASTLRAYLLEKFPDYMVPAFYEIKEKLPTNTSGKIDRRVLAEETGIATRTKSAFCPTTEKNSCSEKEQLFAVAQEYLNGVPFEAFDFEEELVEYGIDSLSFVSLLLDIEAEFQIEFEQAVFQMDYLYSMDRILHYILEHTD